MIVPLGPHAGLAKPSPDVSPLISVLMALMVIMLMLASPPPTDVHPPAYMLYPDGPSLDHAMYVVVVPAHGKPYVQGRAEVPVEPWATLAGRLENGRDDVAVDWLLKPEASASMQQVMAVMERLDRCRPGSVALDDDNG